MLAETYEPAERMPNLISELKRRNVFKVAVAYLVAGWLLLQVTDLVAGVLGLPDWTLRLVGFLVLLGLPPVLLFSWVYELTPEGLKKEKDLGLDAPGTMHAGRRLNLVIAALMLIAVPLLTVQIISHGGIGAIILPDSAPEIQAKVDASGLVLPDYDSVAVLPFVNMSADPGNEYFSDGLTEELLNLLVEVRGLRVPSRTSSFAFKGQNVDLGVIGKALGVNHVLEGSVRKSGDHIRVTAQLIDVRTDTHLWSETYDRQLADIFEIQDDIAGRIVAALRRSLGGKGLLPERTRPTEDMQAYDLYLQGLELFRQRGDSLPAALGLLQQSIDLDPNFAAAWATLAAVYSVQWDYDPALRVSDSLESARVAAEQALVLDPGSSLAQAVLAASDQLAVPRRWDSGFQRFDKGIAEHPRDSNMRLWYGLGLTEAGYLEAGKMQFLAAYRQDPASGVNNLNLGKAYMLTGDLDKAVSYLNRASALGSHKAPDVLRMLYFHMRLDDRLLEVDSADPVSIPNAWWVALVQARQDPAKAPALLQLTERYRSTSHRYPEQINSCLFELGLLDNYPDAIRANYASNPDVMEELWYPWNGGLRQAPEFTSLVEELGLLDLWRVRGFPDLCKEDAGQLVCQ